MDLRAPEPPDGRVEPANAPIRLGEAQRPSTEPSRLPATSSAATLASGGPQPLPQPAAVPDDPIADLLRQGMTYSDKFPQPATLTDEENRRLIRDASTMAEAQRAPDPESPVEPVRVQDVAPLRKAVAAVLQEGFRTDTGFVLVRRMREALPNAPKLETNVDPRTHNPFSRDRLLQHQASEAQKEPPRYRTVLEPITESQAQRYRDELREVWAKVSAPFAEQPGLLEGVQSFTEPPPLDWKRVAERVLQDFTTKGALTVGNVMDVQAAKRAFDIERGEDHLARSQRLRLVELLCMAGASAGVPESLLPEEWRDAAGPLPPGSTGALLRAFDAPKTSERGNQLAPSIQRFVDDQAAEEADRRARDERIAKARIMAGVDLPGRGTPEHLKRQMVLLGSQVRNSDTKAVAAFVREALPDAAGLKVALSSSASGQAVEKLAAFFDGLRAKPDADVAKIMEFPHTRTEVVVRPQTPEDLAPLVSRPEHLKLLQEGQAFYSVQFVDPKDPLNTRFHLFYWTGSGWQMLGMYWKILDS